MESANFEYLDREISFLDDSFKNFGSILYDMGRLLSFIKDIPFDHDDMFYLTSLGSLQASYLIIKDLYSSFSDRFDSLTSIRDSGFDE